MGHTHSFGAVFVRRFWRGLGLVAILFGLLGVSGARAADVAFYGVIKGENYSQRGPGIPALSDDKNGDGRFYFNAFVNLTGFNSVTNARVQVPVSGASPDLHLNQGGNSQEFSESFDAPLFLDGTYPNGLYVLTLKTKNDGVKNINLTLSGTYPSIPVVNNFGALQSVNPANIQAINWTVSGGTAADFVKIEIVESTGNGNDTTVYQTPEPGQPGALSGTATTLNLPANTLVAGHVYQGRILVARGTFDTTSYGNGVSGVVAYSRRTAFSIITTGVAADIYAPQLNTVTPWNGATAVPTQAVVAFTFNERMQTNVSLQSSVHWDGGGVNDTNVTYTWGLDSRTVYCTYEGGWPASATVTWVLNPDGGEQALRDRAGNLFSPDYAGQFSTGAAGGSGVKDVQGVFVYKGRGAIQTNASGPVSLGVYLFGFSADFTTFNTVTNGSVTVPGSQTVVLPQRDEFPYGDNLEVQASYDSQAAMDGFFPDGNYTVTLQTVHDGTKTATLSLNGSTYPNLPSISNFAAAQAVDSTNAFTINWGTFSGGTAADYVLLRVENDQGQTVYETAQPGQAGVLTGLATSATIPAGKLYPGRTYQGRLQFIKVVDTNTGSYPGVTVASAYSSETQFELRTTGVPILAALAVRPPSGGQFVLRLTGEPGRDYTIEASDTLQSGTWFQVGTSTADEAGHLEFTDSSSFGKNHRFYRAREGFSNSN